ncbi:hypothetical protein KKC65_03450 [Patescibacteria group bacterium]|nr:hypothetical protein [Patescibacteria group bacterium]
MKYKYLFLIVLIGTLLNIGVVLAQEIDQEMMGIWTKTWNWLKNIFENVWHKTSAILGQQVEQRRPEIEEEFQKELEEMKEDVPKTTNSLWQRLKELVR